jgi:YHS domain-containing protein
MRKGINEKLREFFRMGWLLRLLFLAFIMFLIISGVRRLLLPTPLPRRNRKEEKGQEGVLMIQDPQCGRFVPEREAFTASFQGRVLHFCSQECRDLYTRPQATEG